MNNIRVGWKATGLYPFNPSRVLDGVPGSLTPVRQLPRTPLASLCGNNIEYLQSCNPSLPTPVKDRITSLVGAVESERAKNTVLEKENQKLRDAVGIRKRKRAGITVGNLGTHVFSTQQCLERVVARETVTAARKRKGKDKAVPDGEEQPIDDVYGASDGMEVELYGLHSFGDEY